MNNTENALVVVFAFFVAVCILSLIGGRLARPARPAEHDDLLKPPQFLPCAQPMSPRVRATYVAIVILLLLACVGANYWPGEIPAPFACQVSSSDKS